MIRFKLNRLGFIQTWSESTSTKEDVDGWCVVENGPGSTIKAKFGYGLRSTLGESASARCLETTVQIKDLDEDMDCSICHGLIWYSYGANRWGKGCCVKCQFEGTNNGYNWIIGWLRISLRPCKHEVWEHHRRSNIGFVQCHRMGRFWAFDWSMPWTNNRSVHARGGS